MTGALPALDRVVVRDVGPRDGLQPEAPVSVEDRIRLIESLVVAGLTRIEVAAFVSPKAVPAMAGAADVVAGLTRPEGVTYAALVPNVRGAELALAAAVDELTVTISASATYNERNVKMSIDESVDAIESITALAGTASVPVDAVISCCFGSPYEGEITASQVLTLARRLEQAGVTSLTYADTTGMATPRLVVELTEAIPGGVGWMDTGLHLHDTRGTGLVNAYAALQQGVARFDTAVGGLGGSPFAHGAGGNLATEGLVALLDDLGVRTGIDLDRLLEAAELLGTLVDRTLPSPIAHHGPRTRPAPPTRTIRQDT